MRRSMGSVDELAAGRDRALDAARALAMTAVAVGHWLVAEPVRTSDGLLVRDVLASVPSAAPLSWVFQVIPLFMFAGYAVGTSSWQRHRQRGGSAGAWTAARVWRLLWPTLPMVWFWTVVTQVGDHLLGLDDELLAATRGIGLVLWFLAIYVVLMALLPALEWLADRFGTLPMLLACVVPALAVDVVAARVGYTSSTEPSWVWVNYLLWWAPVALAGRWWPRTTEAAARRVAAAVAAGAFVVLVAVTSLGWYPTSMVGVTGLARSNTLPPTLALALLAAVQVGLLFASAEWLRRVLANPRRYVPVALVGSRAMTIYLWHLLAPVVVAITLVLPGAWPSTAVGTAGWWAGRLAWVAVNAVVLVPVVLAFARFERPPSHVVLTGSALRTGAAVALSVLGWAAIAVAGLHVPGWPAAFPWVQVAALAAAAVALVGGVSGRRTADTVTGSA